MQPNREYKRVDVLVVGAGVIGLSAAYHIKKNNPGLSVLIVESEAAPAQGQTAKSFAAVRDCFTSDLNQSLAGSTIEAYEHVQKSGFNLNLELIGYLWLFTKSQLAHFESIKPQLTEHGVQLRVLDLAQVVQMIPDLVLHPKSEQSRLMSLERIQAAVQCINCGTVSPELVAKYYESEFKRLGGEFQFHTEVTSLRLAPRTPLRLPSEPYLWQEKVFTGVETNRGRIDTETIVLAAGPQTPFLLDAVGVDCHVKTKKRQIFQLRGKQLDRLLDTNGLNEENTVPVTILPMGGIHFRPVLGERSIWVAAADDLGRPFKFEEDPAAEESYYRYHISPVLSEYFPCFAQMRPSNSWAGLYDINSLDGAPIIERVNSCIIVAGLSGSGIMKADAVGRVAAAAFEGKEEATLFDGRRIEVSHLGLEERAVAKEQFVL